MDKSNSNVILYQSVDGATNVEVILENETVWLTQEQMSQLFQKTQSTINEHIKNIYKEKELDQYQTMSKFGNSENRLIKAKNYYNLDVIISVGYRVRSVRGTQFRIWATHKLKEYLVKGFVMNDNHLAQGGNYFDELLERVRAIRSSEKNFYEKVRDTFATSVDYNPKTETAKEFFASVQNKFHFAITGHTAAEIVAGRVDSNSSNLGLTNWGGKIVTRKEAEIAKNYLAETELKQLQLLVEQFLSFAELQVERKVIMYMEDWRGRLNEFLKLNRLQILDGKGVVSHVKMQDKVRRELKKYLDNLKTKTIN